ncbi:MAG: DNA ligase [Pseudomonadota bacterium]
MGQSSEPVTSHRRIALPILLFSALWLTGAFCAQALEKPGLPLANIYREGVDLSQYWVSEKLDGVRAYWTGSLFLSRNGNGYAAPVWFTAGFPSVPLDGELWMGRASFQQLVSAVRKQQPNDLDWHRIQYMVFDLPTAIGGFTERLERLESLIQQSNSPYIQLVEQVRVPDHQSLMKRLAQVVEAGGEGLMLHHEASRYQAGRSDDLLKVKPYMDAEARVIAHLPGQGKYTGLLGALLVESADGKRFRIGTGFSDAERRMPPAIGSLVTYQYRGFTDSGVPRFPSYLRVREE